MKKWWKMETPSNEFYQKIQISIDSNQSKHHLYEKETNNLNVEKKIKSTS